MMMNQTMQTFLSSALVSAVLWCGLQSAQAAVTPGTGNTPPGFDVTQALGPQLASGLSTVQSTNSQLEGGLANYNATTPATTDKTFLGNIMRACNSAPGILSAGTPQSPTYDFSKPGAGAALLANSLLSTEGYPDDSTRCLAYNFVIFLSNPSPMPYPGDSDVYKDPKDKTKGLTDDGVKYFASIYKQQTMLTVAQDILLSILGDRTPIPGLGNGMPFSKDGKASPLQLMSYDATRRYTDASWYQALGGATDQAVMREIAYMMAFQNYMAVRQYEQNQQIMTLLAAQLSNSNGLAAQGAAASSPNNQKQLNQSIQSNS